MIVRILKISFWLCFAVGIFFTMGFVDRKQSEQVISAKDVEISIDQEGSNQFLNEDLLKKRIKMKFGYTVDSVELTDIDIREMEGYLKSMSEVKNVEVFKSVDGHLYISMKERTPIVRILHQNGMSNYLDKEGDYMALSPVYSAHVLIVSGNINESAYRLDTKEINADKDLDTLLLSDDIYELASYIYNDEFWQAQIQQVHINNEKEYELIPIVGDHRIIFGSLDNMDRKFRKLKIFYEEGLKNTGWNEFDTINLMYKNQIVCS